MALADDPTATYRGYRCQALYVLYRLFDEALPSDSKIQPEGEEDLAVYDGSDNLSEVIQVKALSEPLTVSSFKPSFFQRIVQHCAAGTDTKVSIISYGPVGPELENALSGDAEAAVKVTKKLAQAKTKKVVKNEKIQSKTTPGLSEADAKNIVDRLTLSKVSEQTLHNSVILRLKATVAGVDPSSAFDFLMWWMLTSSENQRVISREMAIAKIQRIGKFLSARAAHHNQWNRSIIPITSTELTEPRKKRLEEGFFRGGRVRFDHIEAGLDVPRGTTIDKIHSSFFDNDIVVVHSASGQGKTTLAYRYAKEFAPAEFRFEVLPPDNLAHARDMALAIVGHADAIEVPTLVYVDVRPGDRFWVELVRELASVDGLRVLVTIREEDWTRANISVTDFDFKSITLTFGESEAIELYTRLIERGVKSKHLDFIEAWEKFGARKTLFEFVYFITQHQSLAKRIKTQITSIEDSVNEGKRPAAELEFLRRVSVASAYEARLELEPLVEACNLPAAKRTIEIFEHEYLVRVSEDRKFIEGFHPVRSEIMSAVLTDPILCPWRDVAIHTLSHIAEEDLEPFLLCSFSRRPETSSELVEALTGFTPKTWAGVRNVMFALMWNGIREYVKENESLIGEAHDNCEGWWLLALDWDLARSNGFNIFENLGKLGSNAKEISAAYRKRQSEKSVVFDQARVWLGSIKKRPGKPVTPKTWLSMAEVLYWVGHISIPTILAEYIDTSELDEAIDSLPIHQLGRFLLGIRVCFPTEYAKWLESSSEQLRRKLRSDAGFLALCEDEDEIVGHFLIDLDREAVSLRNATAKSSTAEATIHDLTIERIELLGQVFPEKKRYGAVGYGHRSSLVPVPIDDADKPGVLADNLYPPWLPSFNSLSRGCVELYFRQETWQDYFDMVSDLRARVVDVLLDLHATLLRILGSSSLPSNHDLEHPEQWEECQKMLRVDILLPKIAVDEWGFASESSSSQVSSNTERSHRSTLERFAPITRALNDYKLYVENFVTQALKTMILIPHLRNAKTNKAATAIREKAVEYGMTDDLTRHSVMNGIDACKAVLDLQRAIGREFPKGEFPGIDSEFGKVERTTFNEVMVSWCKFANPSRRSNDGNTKRRTKKRGKTKPRFALTDFLTGTRNRLKNELRALRKNNIHAELLSETVRWNCRSALWIRFDVDHPAAILTAIDKVWDRLVAAFQPDQDSFVRQAVIDFVWEEIVLVPTVQGKSIDKYVMPHLKVVASPNPPSIQESTWRMAPTEIGVNTAQQLGLEIWHTPALLASMEGLLDAYSSLFQMIDHLADFSRMKVDVDQEGERLFQAYLKRRGIRLNSMMRATEAAFEGVMSVVNECEDLEDRPNLLECNYLLVEAGSCFQPSSVEEGTIQMSIDQIVDWRNRLRKGLELLGVTKYFWFADRLDFGERCPVK